MNLFYLRYFVTLAHVQQYTKAAEQLCIAQPSLSHAISQMEKELGLPLFEKKRTQNNTHAFWRRILGLCRTYIVHTGRRNRIHPTQRPWRGINPAWIPANIGCGVYSRVSRWFLKENPNSDIQFTFHTGVTKSLFRRAG